MVAVPSFVSANARRGLDLLEFAGDGLKQQTINEARAMARGSVTPEKVRRMAAWFARHSVDLSSPDAQAYLNDKKDRPTAGQVAWLLWGGDLGANKLRAMNWAERKRDQLIEDGELSKAEYSADDDANETGIVEPMIPMMTAPSQPNNLVVAMRDTLANVFVFYASAHRAHWNVVGDDFLQYHALFADIYDDVYGSVDPFAENIRKLKGTPLNLTEIVNHASFADDSTTSSAYELAADLYAKNVKVTSMLKLLFVIANDANEQGIANFIAERIDAHMKWDWQLGASLVED